MDGVCMCLASTAEESAPGGFAATWTGYQAHVRPTSQRRGHSCRIINIPLLYDFKVSSVMFNGETEFFFFNGQIWNHHIFKNPSVFPGSFRPALVNASELDLVLIGFPHWRTKRMKCLQPGQFAAFKTGKASLSRFMSSESKELAFSGQSGDRMVAVLWGLGL